MKEPLRARICVLFFILADNVQQNIPLKRLQDRHNKKRQFAHQKLQIGIWNKVKTFQTKLVYKCKWYFWPKSILCWCPLGGLQRRKGPHGVSKATRPFIFRENSVKEGDKKYICSLVISVVLNTSFLSVRVV